MTSILFAADLRRYGRSDGPDTKLYRACFAAPIALVDAHLARDALLVAVAQMFWPTAEPVELDAGLRWNHAWFDAPAEEPLSLAIRVEPATHGQPAALISLDAPRAGSGHALEGYRQLSAMLLRRYDAPNGRNDRRDLLLTAAGYLAVLTAIELELSGASAILAVGCAIAAIAHAMGEIARLDDPMPIGYLDPLLARGIIGLSGVLDLRPRWFEASPGAQIRCAAARQGSTPALHSNLPKAFLELCAAVRPTTLDLLLPESTAAEASAHDRIAAAALLHESSTLLHGIDLPSRLEQAADALQAISQAQTS